MGTVKVAFDLGDTVVAFAFGLVAFILEDIVVAFDLVGIVVAFASDQVPSEVVVRMAPNHRWSLRPR